MLGLVFVLLVCFLRRGLIGGIEDLSADFGNPAGAGNVEPQEAAPLERGGRERAR